MNPSEYASQQAVISSAIVNYVLTFGRFFTKQKLSLSDWLTLLGLIYPQVQRSREESAKLARVFYDEQRKLEHPNAPRNDQDLVAYKYEWFVENMEPARAKMSQEDSPQDAIATLALRAVREVENAGRRQIITAVADDPVLIEAAKAQPKDTPPESRVIRGWARVATGRETCAWCLMLCSRGPVYLGADTAGLDLDDASAARMIAAGEDVSEFMEEWHDGCDCKVVPVYKTEQNWFGKAAADRALELWKDATRQAIREEKSDPDRKHLAGKNKGKPFTRNERAINALRRRLDEGEISPTEFAALAAA